MTLGELGQKLREKREQQGLSINDVAEKIKVSSRILALIEEGNHRGLPHAVYARGFIISYALLLDYDADELQADLSQPFPPNSVDELQPQSSSISCSMPTARVGQRVFALLLFLLFLGCIGYGGWYVVSNYGTDIMDIVKKPFSAVSVPDAVVLNTADVPESFPNVAPVINEHTIPITDSDNSSFVVNLSPGSADGAASAPIVVPERVEKTYEPATSLSSNQPETVQASIITPQAANRLEVFVRGNNCWVSYEVDGARAIEKTLPAGAHDTVAYKDKLSVVIGNPGVVSLVHNDKPYTRALNRNKRAILHFP